MKGDVSEYSETSPFIIAFASSHVAAAIVLLGLEFGGLFGPSPRGENFNLMKAF